MVLLLTVQINAVPARGRCQILPNVTSILVYTPKYFRADIEFNRLYKVYLFEGTFSKFMKQKLVLCISLIR